MTYYVSKESIAVTYLILDSDYPETLLSVLQLSLLHNSWRHLHRVFVELYKCRFSSEQRSFVSASEEPVC